MTKERALDLLNTYGKAWVERDPNLILEIFTNDATYDDPRETKNFGHEGIYNYWVSKVVNGQRDVKLKYLMFG
jgi:predicted secreted protein